LTCASKGLPSACGRASLVAIGLAIDEISNVIDTCVTPDPHVHAWVDFQVPPAALRKSASYPEPSFGGQRPDRMVESTVVVSQARSTRSAKCFRVCEQERQETKAPSVSARPSSSR
jgi:hypothetical protein